jgi:2,4-dichlorophenol 6-monooxygenase
MFVSSVETDVLIVGAGPAGASSAVFLSKHGVRNIVISRHRSTATTPRAHHTNQRTMEALRDAGLERQCMSQASFGASNEHTFWLRSMVGEELARSYAWGNNPMRKGDYEAASPCRISNLPQNQLEPILFCEAARLGSHVRFEMELLSFEQDEQGVTALLLDRMTQSHLNVRAKYMVGADGARSGIVEKLGIPLTGREGLGSAISVFCEAELSKYLTDRQAALYHIVPTGSSKWGPLANFRMVRPWDQWVASLMRPASASDPDEREIEARLHEIIGAQVPIKILDKSTWSINDLIASHYSVGRVFCMGDAVHRHSPANGLGSNTCVQDAFNLAWKLAFVLQGKASARLLDSFNLERQPVGRQVVKRADKSLGINNDLWNFMIGNKEHAMSSIEYQSLLGTSEGRVKFRSLLKAFPFENHAHGVELNRHYVSNAVVEDDKREPVAEDDDELFYHPNTRPGAPLPHVWLGKREAGPRVSSLDLAGKRRFTMFSGHGGERWREAARAVLDDTSVEIVVILIGPYLDYEDLYGRWSELSAIQEDGCVLIRPDLYVAWRCDKMPADPIMTLSAVMRELLGSRERN